jgi:hypothetical protein
MDTSGRTVLGAGGGQEQAKQMFGKVRGAAAAPGVLGGLLLPPTPRWLHTTLPAPLCVVPAPLGSALGAACWPYLI